MPSLTRRRLLDPSCSLRLWGCFTPPLYGIKLDTSALWHQIVHVEWSVVVSHRSFWILEVIPTAMSKCQTHKEAAVREWALETQNLRSVFGAVVPRGNPIRTSTLPVTSGSMWAIFNPLESNWRWCMMVYWNPCIFQICVCLYNMHHCCYWHDTSWLCMCLHTILRCWQVHTEIGSNGLPKT